MERVLMLSLTLAVVFLLADRGPLNAADPSAAQLQSEIQTLRQRLSSLEGAPRPADPASSEAQRTLQARVDQLTQAIQITSAGVVIKSPG